MDTPTTDASTRVDAMGWRPRNCVWELTLACNLRCAHCGSRAGRVRDRELSLEECLAVVDPLADLGCELVTLSGGEPTLKRGWDTLARAVADRGILVNMVTNGVYRSDAHGREVARRAADAGLCNVGVSLDGPQAVHEHVRGAGTFARTLAAVGQFRAAGLRVGVLTTISRLNLPHLEAVRQIAMDAGATLWRLQLAKPMGAMAEHRDHVIAPRDLLDLLPRLARLKRAGGIHLTVGDSIGYYGPHDKVLRGRGWRGRTECWQGCQAGMQAIGIEANGDVKGCLSLQARIGGRDPFVEGNLRRRTLRDIWTAPGAFAFNRDVGPDQLTGGCRACRFATLCRGGARCVSSAVLGRLTEDPYCWYRVACDERARHAGTLARWTAAAGAALALSVAPACSSESTPGQVAADAALVDGSMVDGSMVDGSGVDVAGGTDAAAPDAGAADVPVSADVAPDSAGTPDTAVPDVLPPDADVAWDVAADLDAMADDGAALDVPDPDAIDCSAVCCECEYGVIPEEVWQACCAPDPCANACCECDYGEPPPPECCP